ncbi:MAG: squalene synthase HpnC [Azospirillaceae bacterium]|nr:squalene synthase HpnC [Azospirillaceae bacterium]
MSATIETPSGKGRSTENFPVGSMLIRPDLRRHVHAFYQFARVADDVADNPALDAEDKIARLDRMAAALTGAPDPGVPAATEMARSLRDSAVPPFHCLDLLRAFRRDAVQSRYADWGDLIDYCNYSANPVGRYLLDLHAEAPATWPASDALCSALQVLNHLQDCGDDYREMDRVYVPADHMAAAGVTVEALSAAQSSPGLRRCLDLLLDRTDALIVEAWRLPGQIRDRRLRGEAAAIVALARRLAARLRRGDPLAHRIKLCRWDFAVAGCHGLLAAGLGGPG